MKRSKLLTYVSEGLAALALAGTLFTSTVCATPHSYKLETLEQKVTKKEQVRVFPVGNVAVLLIDMQEDFLEDIASEEKSREIPYQLDVLDYCKEKSIPVFVLEYKNNGPTTKVLKDKVDSLEKKAYITKKYDDGFEDTSLAEQLRKHNINTLLLMGVNATACVISTANSALKAGFNIMTSKDLIADKQRHNTDEGARWYSAKGVYRDNYKDLLDIISKGEAEIIPSPEDNLQDYSIKFPND